MAKPFQLTAASADCGHDAKAKRKLVICLGFAAAAAMALAVMLPATPADATPVFRTQTGKKCSYCHSAAPSGPNAGDELTPAGVAFRDNNYRLPTAPVCPPGCKPAP